MNELELVLRLPSVQTELIYLYQKSQSECTKHNKLSMEVGTSREKDIIAVLRYHMKQKVVYNVGVHAPEDITICEQKFSIKHSSSKVGKGSIKWKWTSDAYQARQFKEQVMTSFTDIYYSNMLLVYMDVRAMIVTLIGIDKQTIISGIQNLMDDAFVNRAGTNNRGVEFSPRMLKYIIDRARFRITLANADFSCKFDPIQERIVSLQHVRTLKMKLD